MNIALFTKSWPRHNYNGSLQKSISLIQSLINMNHNIVICSDEQDYKLKQQIKQYPIELIDINIKKISISLNNFNKLQFKPNMFIFDSIQSQQKYSAFLYNRWNKCARILTINQLKGLQKWRKNNYKLIPNVLIPNNAYLSPQKIQQIITIQQQRSIQRSDYILTSNQHTYHLLNKHIFKNKQTKYISQINYGYPLQQYYGEITQLRYRPFKNRQNFVFIGNFNNQSNKDCIFVLVNYIWPMIRQQLSKVQLHIYGTGGVNQQNIWRQFGQNNKFSKQNLKKLGIHFKGRLNDTETLSQYKALLYPCVFSTGSHIKITQSWFSHLPVVTTPIGAQGLFLQSYDPQFVGSLQNNTNNIFTSQRIFSQEQKKNSQLIRNYYNNRIMNKNNMKFRFGGSYDSFTYKDFIQNSIKMYKDQQFWNQCLKNGQNIIKNNQNDRHLEVLLKKALVSIQIATYEGRGRASYEEQWKRYTKSSEFNKKIRG